ncbi:hypothetical protein [Mycolicibacterium mageritense]|uniref:MarR family transcriptional regulator n=1 Tax=Mycolicibacterium mageritense TaxID=53462 RepID=A0ABM7I6G5_MYCME|nr:hypothetical protein [Mycolicibacterium mageritense]BBX38545.1 hypothetical protein MMAGJ_78270 [Mycolicibacterium mageritense]
MYQVLAERGELTQSGVEQHLSTAQRKVARELLRALAAEGRAGYDGALWFAIYQGRRLTKLRVVEG